MCEETTSSSNVGGVVLHEDPRADGPLLRSVSIGDLPRKEQALPRASPLTTKPPSHDLPSSPPPSTAATSSEIKNDDGIEPDWSFLQHNKLYGREQEIHRLRQALADIGPHDIRVNAPHQSLTLVSGRSGTGKSVLVRTALERVVRQDRNGFFCVGKFDQLQVPEPYAPFVAALTQLVQQWQEKEQASTTTTDPHKFSTSLLREAGPEACGVLQALVPATRQVLEGHYSHEGCEEVTITTAHGREAQKEKLQLAIRKLLQAICGPRNPLVLVLDDLQWADEASLAVLRSLLNPEDPVEGLLLVAVCRSEEVGFRHGFASVLRSLEDVHGIPITHVAIENLGLRATTDLLADVLHQPAHMCRALAAILRERTQGNAFYVHQFLKALWEEGVLFASSADRQWLWDDKRWDASFLNTRDDRLPIVELVTSRIQRLPKDCQRLLSAAAFMGAELEVDTLQAVLASEEQTPSSHDNNLQKLQRALHMACQEGLIEPRPQQSDKYVFCHDQIQFGAYALVPEKERASFHLSIGRTLYQRFTQNPEEDMLYERIFLVVNQMIRGASLLTAEVDLFGLAHLCLQAGKKSIRSSDFQAATTYLETGAGLCEKNKRQWRDEYRLCLDLYSSLAEATCCVARYDRMDEVVEEILLNARTYGDKMRAYSTKIYSLGARLRLREALDLGKLVLIQLGEKLPTKPGIFHFIRDLTKVKMKLSKVGKTNEDILALPDLSESTKHRNKSHAMAILSMLATYTYVEEPNLYPNICFTMVRISLEHGLSPMSSHGFSLYSVIMCVMDDYEGGYRFSQLALKLLDRYDSTKSEWLPRVHATVYGLTLPWKQPLDSTLDTLLETHLVGQHSGDLEFSMLAHHFRNLNSFVAGKPMPTIKKDLKVCLDLMVQLKQETWHPVASLLLQVIQNLEGQQKGVDGDPFMITCEMEGEMGSRKAYYQACTCSAMVYQLMLAYHFDDLPQAMDCAHRSRVAERLIKPSMLIWIQYFYDGMAALKAARVLPKQKRKHLAQGRAAKKRFEKLAALCPANMQHYAYLLTAELLELKGKHASATEYYTKAIAHAQKEGCLHIEALACECLGLAQLRQGGDKGAAGDYFKRAVRVYGEWGALSIVSFKKQQYDL